MVRQYNRIFTYYIQMYKLHVDAGFCFIIFCFLLLFRSSCFHHKFDSKLKHIFHATMTNILRNPVNIAVILMIITPSIYAYWNANNPSNGK